MRRLLAPVLVAGMLLVWAEPAEGGFAAGVPVEGFIPDLTISAKGGWARLFDDQMRLAGLTNGWDLGIEVSWN